jgi:hypothetical protein
MGEEDLSNTLLKEAEILLKWISRWSKIKEIKKKSEKWLEKYEEIKNENDSTDDNI